jgi:hypothetical protein
VTSVAELLAGVGSETVPGNVMLAVLLIVPVAEAMTVAEIVNVAEPPGARLTEADTLPLPDAGHDDPALAEQVHVAPLSVAGSVSLTVAPVTVDGPGLDATTVYVTSVPGTTVLRPSVLVIETSAVGVSVSMSVAELLAELGSVPPAGADTLAVLVSDPVAVEEMATRTVYVTVAPVAMVAVLEIGIEPDADPHAAPAVAAHVHEPDVAPAGRASVTGALTAVDGPALPTTTVYVVLWPGMTAATPSVFVIDRSAVGFNVSVSVAELLAGVGSVTPPGTAIAAVFTRLPVAVATTVAEIVNVADPPTGRSTMVAMLPLPLPAAQDPPPAGTHVHVTPESDAGMVSVTGAAVTADGPALAATIV